jgi:phytoene desaturase
MRTVSGPTDHVVVVGAGLGGLSAAMRLAAAGRQVTVLERETRPGGRAGLWETGGFRIDTGPGVLTMPGLLDDAFAALGEERGRWLPLRRLDPAYRARFADGSSLDVRADPDDMAEEVRRVCGPADAAGFARFAAHARRMYSLEMPHFIDRAFDSPLDLLRPPLARLVAMGGLRRLAPSVASFVTDDRLRRILSFQALYAGLSPFDALAIYSVIAYMDVVAGVWFPEGGMAAVPQAMADAATRAGVQFRYATTAAEVELAGSRAVAIRTTDGERIPADVVVLNPDLPVAWRTLLPVRDAPRRLSRLRASPSCVLLLAGSRRSWPDQAHHTIHFGAAWRETFDELTDRRHPRLQRDPSLLVTSPTVTDPSLAPTRQAVHSVLVPTPNLDAGIDWDATGPGYRDEVVARLERAGYPGFGDAVVAEQLVTPADWERRGMDRGTPFASAHTFGQTGPFRPSELAYDNVVFVGSGTRPGVGIPMVLVSGRLAALRITGADGQARQ